MIIKKFTAKTENEAVENAKKELGENIVIMNVKEVKHKGFFAFLKAKQMEVTVALEDEKENLRFNKLKEETAKAEQTKKETVVKNDNEHTQSIGVNLSAGSNSIEKKLDSLQTLLESQFQKGDMTEKKAMDKLSAETDIVGKEVVPNSGNNAPAEEVQKDRAEQDKFFRLLYNTMIENEVDEKYANQIMEEAEKNRKPNVPMDYILASIYQKMVLKFGKAEGILPAQKGPRLVVFIGPTGVGKTTTIAKIASSYVFEEKKKVAMLTMDTYRIAATEQLHTYANILEVPFRIIYGAEEFEEACEVFKEYDYIFVDTAGHSYQNEEQMDNTQKYVEKINGLVEMQAFLVLSATTKYKDLKKIADKYKKVVPFQLIFTKLDETTSYGNLYNLKMYTDAPIAYVTYGQNVPDDMERFQPQKCVKQLLGGNSRYV